MLYIMDITALVLTAIGLVLGGGTVGAVVTSFAMRKKTNAEAESTLSSAILSYANKLTNDNDKLRKEMDKMDDDVTHLQKKLREARVELDKARDHAQKLQEIIAALEVRKSNDQTIIEKLFQAIKIADPSNPLLAELQSMFNQNQASLLHPPK